MRFKGKVPMLVAIEDRLVFRRIGHAYLAGAAAAQALQSE
jgi:hypothetical protein